MADFSTGFWSWFIAGVTLAGIAALFWLNRWMATPRRKDVKQTETTGHVWDEDLKELNNPLPRWWLNLFYLTLVFGLVYLALYPGLGGYSGMLGWSQRGQYEQETAEAEQNFGAQYEKYSHEDLAVLATNAEALKTGERLFVNYCTACHGSDARGARGFPNLRDNDWLWGGDPQTIKQSIMEGRSGAMPAWGPVLGADGVRNVAAYVRSLSKLADVDELAATAGREKFQQLCVACHGPEGKGNPALGAPNLTDKTWLYGSTSQIVMETIEKGRSGRMPAHNDFLGEAKVHVLAAYIYSLSHPPAVAATNSLSTVPGESSGGNGF
ncbi:MAG: cytochrome-c oxidase, cbb3-type subunit III [Gammaproteobacteria bacterium]|nr:cytochrome-c oxidase, cbb3-type subunit III [Gammaproteobacteria bacterium]